MLGDLRLLRDRRFALLFSARSISVIGTVMAPVALAFAVLDLPGATPTTLGLVLASYGLALVLFVLLGGVFADRFPRYRVLIGSELLAALTGLTLATLFLTGTAPLPVLMVVVFLHGVAGAMFYPAFAGIIPQVVPNEQLPAANGLLRLTFNGARITGLAFAGALITAVGPGWALAADAATYLISAALLAGVRVPKTKAGSGASMLADLREGWQEFASRQWIWVIVLQFSIVNAAFAAGFGVYGPVIAKQDLGGAAGWSAVLVAQAAGMFLGVLVAMRIRPRRPMLIATLAVFPYAVPVLLLGTDVPLAVLITAAFLAGVSVDIFSVLWDTTLQRHVPGEALSRVSAYDMLGSFMVGPLGMLLAGPAAAVVGVKAAAFGCGALMVAVTALALLSPQVRRLPAAMPTGGATTPRAHEPTSTTGPL
ncbi:MAG: MFS transporter [Micromonosporaceae bacterium]|nr:MFS transporter [Micromonosporaceae bacterium]